MISYSEAQALALITDPGTLKRGQELLKPAKWANLGRTATAAWGDCAGSGTKPYLTGIDLTEPAFKCSCPSRVFPCKHGAGLLLLMARQPALFGGDTPPAWLAEWLEKRQQNQEKKAEKPAPKASEAAVATPAAGDSSATALVHGEEVPSGSPSLLEKGPGDEVAAVAGLTVDPKRLARMVAGTEDLVAWLEDLLRAGLATLDQQPARFWESQAARLVDNQLPGLAATMRELATLRHAHADWPARLLGRLGELYLLARALLNLPALGPEARADVLQLVGINLKKEDLLSTAAPVADSWRVMGQFRWEEERLTARRTWLHGRHTSRTALVLEFSFGGQSFSTPFIPHGAYLGELVFYPGLLPLRAAPVSLKFDGTVPLEVVPTGQSIGQLLDDYATALARQPWLREWPATLAQVLPVRQADGQWQLHHATEPLTLPLRFAAENAGWELLAQSGGQPLALFGEWDGRAFRPLSSWVTNAAGVLATAPETLAAPAAAATQTVAVPGSTPAQASPLSASPRPGNEVDWSQLLRVSLLGTRQSGEAIPAFLRPAPSPEQQLLLAAGTQALMRKAGHQPPAPTTAPPAPAPPETWVPLGPTGASLLAGFLAGQQRYYYRHFHKLEHARRRVPHQQVVSLLNYVTKNGYQESLVEHSALLGTHGEWLAAQNPEWQSVVRPKSEKAESVWETGTPIARRFFLEQVFETDPDRAIGLLTDALPQETATTQISLLAAVHGSYGQRYPLPAALAPVLEPLLKSRTREVRQVAVRQLVQTTNNALEPRLWARAAPLLSIVTMRSGPDRLEITLPDHWTAEWQREGIEQRTTEYAGGERAGWLGQLLALIPPQQWTTRWRVSPAQAVALAAASEWPGVVLPAWLRAAHLHSDAAFARALLDHETQHPTQPADLVVAAGRIMPENEKLDWLLSFLPIDPATLPKPAHWVEWLFIPDMYDYPTLLLQRALPLLSTLLAEDWVAAHWQPDRSAAEQKALQLLEIFSEDVDEALLPLFETHLNPVLEAQPRLAPKLLAVLAAFLNRRQLTASLTEPAEGDSNPAS